MGVFYEPSTLKIYRPKISYILSLNKEILFGKTISTGNFIVIKPLFNTVEI